jgi:hypothetical protein
MADTIVETIVSSAKTGRIGDGKSRAADYDAIRSARENGAKRLFNTVTSGGAGMTPKEVLNMAKENGAKMVDLKFIDLLHYGSISAH